MQTLLLALVLALPFDDVKQAEQPLVAFPQITTPVAPAPVIPTQVTKLSGSQLYIVESDVPCFLIASPLGTVNVKKSGPSTVHGIFVDGQGKFETRELKKKFNFLVTASGKGTTEVIVVIVGATDVDPKYRKTIEVDAQLPIPPPGPNPDPTPTPTPIVAPINIVGYHVLMIEDKQQQDKLTIGQQRAMFGKVARDYLDNHCNKENGQAGYRILDKTTDMKAAPKHWQDAMRPRTSYPWLVVSDGKSGYDGPMPSNFEDIQAILQKYGGQ